MRRQDTNSANPVKVAPGLRSLREFARRPLFARSAKGRFMLLSQRVRKPELMDQPGLDARVHMHALRGLERINRWSGSSRILWRAISALALEQPARPLRVLDIATGAGDVPIRLWQRGQRAGIALQVSGCDISPNALHHARERASAGKSDVHFFPLDILHGSLPTGYDVLCCSLFLHHLDADEARVLLRRMSQAAGHMVLVNDLRRSVAGFFLAALGTQVFSRSHVVHVDGPRSVRAAFTIAEARKLAEEAGLTGATVFPRWPCRFLLKWRRA